MMVYYFGADFATHATSYLNFLKNHPYQGFSSEPELDTWEERFELIGQKSPILHIYKETKPQSGSDIRIFHYLLNLGKE